MPVLFFSPDGNLFLHIAFKAFEVSDQLALFVADRIDVLALVIDTDAKKNLVAVIFQLFNRRDQHFFGFFSMAVKNRLADQIIIAAHLIIMVAGFFIQKADDMVGIDKNDPVGN